MGHLPRSVALPLLTCVSGVPALLSLARLVTPVVFSYLTACLLFPPSFSNLSVFMLYVSVCVILVIPALVVLVVRVWVWFRSYVRGSPGVCCACASGKQGFCRRQVGIFLVYL